MDPAVGVHEPSGYPVHDAVDGVSDVLARGHQQRRGDVDDEGGLVMKPEDVVVDPDFIELQKVPDSLEQAQHFDGSPPLRMFQSTFLRSEKL